MIRPLVAILLYYAFNAIMIIIIASVVITWVPSLRWTPIGRFIFNITEPVFMKFRRIFPPLMIKQGVAMDFSSLAAFFAIYLVYVVLQKYIVPLIP